MKNFKNFLESDSENISESLDSTVEYYMTDDTKLPDNISAVFKIDDTEYHTIIERTSAKGIYLVSFGRLVSKKVRHWTFYKASHVRPALSTLINIIEASVPFLGERAKAFLLKFPIKTDVHKYNKFIDRVVRRSHVKSFRYVPVDDTAVGDDKVWKYGFVVRKTASLDHLFKTKAYRDYEFLDSVEPLRRKPTTKSNRPSTTIQFDGYEFKTVFDKSPENERLAGIVDLKAPEIEDNPEVPQVNDFHVLHKFGAGADETFAVPKGIVDGNKTNIYAASAKTIPYMMNLLDVGANIMQYDIEHAIESKWKLAHIIPNDPESKLIKSLVFMLELLGHVNIVNDETVKIVNYDAIEKIFNKAHSEYWKHAKDGVLYPKLTAYENGESESSANIQNIERLIETGVELKSDLPHQNNRWSEDNYYEQDEDVYSKMQALNDAGGYNEFFNKIAADFDHPLREKFNSLYEYTDSGYLNTNPSLRRFLKDGNSIHEHSFNRISDINDMFDLVTPLPHNIWVYRNAHIDGGVPWDINKMMVDSAILSCSIKSRITIGEEGNTRLKIFIPKGSQVIPIFHFSKHASENEVILPPMSLLKPVRLTWTDNGGYAYSKSKRQVIECVYLGTGRDDIIDRISVANAKKAEMQKKMKLFNKESVDMTGKKTYSSLEREIRGIMENKKQKPKGSNYGISDAMPSQEEQQKTIEKIKKGEIKIKKK